MEPALPPSRHAALRPVLVAVLGVAVLATAVGLALHQRNTAGPTPPPVARVAPAPVAPPPASKPSFDIVRVNPHGDAVMAGRATPGSDVTIAEDGKVIGHAQANGQGDWVFVPSAPLPPGPRQLTLTQRAPNGDEVKGDGSVLLVVPDTQTAQAPNAPGPSGAPTSAAGSAPALAVLTGPNAAPRVLQGPEATGGHSGPTLGAVDYDDHGAVRLSGTGIPGATVRVYVDGQPIGDAKADADGHWALSPPASVGLGVHKLRIDQLGADGQVAARVEVPFWREQLTAQAVAAGRMVVQPGQNLWVIARGTYGAGIRYTVIFQANHAQIRDPNLIYPGQVFALPASSDAPTAIPASSNMSR